MIGTRGSAFARVAGTATIALALVACSTNTSPSPSSSGLGGASYSVLPVVVSTDLAPGKNRLLFLFVDQQNRPVSAPDRTASVAVSPGEQPSASASSVPATFQWGNQDAKQGYYIADVTFSQAGPWAAVFTTKAPGAAEEKIPYSFDVHDKHIGVTVGDKAPSTKTPTSADVGGKLSEVSTDSNPDPRFYQLSEDQALAQHKPFVLLFATPAFCQSALCGPTLDRVKAVAKDYPNLTFIHVEPYVMKVVDGKLQPVLDANNQLQSNDITNAWSIPSEPWLFTVDKEGVVQGSLDVVFSDDELRAAIDKVK
ncbi:MAG TPA: hypothetical protein VGK63_08465 [Candidatus Limnocylindrales bacterium]